jgi:hypothetical protein
LAEKIIAFVKGVNLLAEKIFAFVLRLRNDPLPYMAIV